MSDAPLLPDDADDQGCEACLDRLHAWADAVDAGAPPDGVEPAVSAHLRACPDCREDAEGLLALLAAERSG